MFYNGSIFSQTIINYAQIITQLFTWVNCKKKSVRDWMSAAVKKKWERECSKKIVKSKRVSEQTEYKSIIYCFIYWFSVSG